MKYDLAFGPDKTGTKLVVHKIDCPFVRKQAADGEMVASLWGCEGIPEDVERHECLEEPVK